MFGHLFPLILFAKLFVCLLVVPWCAALMPLVQRLFCPDNPYNSRGKHRAGRRWFLWHPSFTNKQTHDLVTRDDKLNTQMGICSRDVTDWRYRHCRVIHVPISRENSPWKGFPVNLLSKVFHLPTPRGSAFIPSLPLRRLRGGRGGEGMKDPEGEVASMKLNRDRLGLLFIRAHTLPKL